MTALARIGVGLVPVFAFLGVLVFMDTFKLLRPRPILQAILAGCAAAPSLSDGEGAEGPCRRPERRRTRTSEQRWIIWTGFQETMSSFETRCLEPS